MSQQEKDKSKSQAYFYNEHPKSCDPEDFWGQVKRTVNGKPVSQEQIDMIVAAVFDGLELAPDDVLLDLCCGNGALSTYFFDRCSGGLGVDTSQYLIDVAHSHFMTSPGRNFIVGDVVDFTRRNDKPERFTKALCYGAICYLSRESVRELLHLLRTRFSMIERLFIGNIADTDRARIFYGERYRPGIELELGSPIGLWWSAADFAAVAAEVGWRTEIRRMPAGYYAAHYRFDAVLTPLQTGAAAESEHSS